MKTKTIVFIALAFIVIGRASASVTSFDSQSAFDAATSGLTTIDFGVAAPPPGGSETLYPAGLTLSGVAFTSPVGGVLAVISQTFCCTTYTRGYDTLDGYPLGINASLPSGVTAVGFLLFAVDDGNLAGTNTDKVDISLGGQTFTVTTATAPTAIFVGFVSTSPISTVSIVPEATANVGTDVMKFSYGVSSTPEPATIWLSAGSLLSLTFLRAARKKR